MSHKRDFLKVVPIRKTEAMPVWAEGEARMSRKRDVTRSSLVSAGEKLMSMRWPGSVSIDDIIDEAAVSKGSFYNHFTDKEALHREIVKDVRTALRERILLETCKVEDPARRVARGCCISFRYCLEYPSRIGFLAEGLGPTRGGPDSIDHGIIGFVSDGIARGRFLLPTMESGVMLAHGLIIAGIVHCIPNMDPFAAIGRVQHLSALLLRGLGIAIPEADQIAAQETKFVIGKYFDSLC